MIFSKTGNLEDHIVELTARGKTSVKSLHTELKPARSLSLRAVYKAVDKLIEADVLLKVGKHVILSEEWVRRVAERLHTAPLAAPSVGERLVYTFSSLEHVDAFWKTVVLPIEESARDPEVFFYNPHNFWACLPERRESEEAYYRHFGSGRRGFFVVGGDFEADREFKRKYQNDYLQIDTRDIGSFSRTNHVTIIGPLLIKVRLTKKVAAKIDDLYALEASIKNLLPRLVKICASPGKIRLILENNPLEAKKMKRILARNFYFSQQ